MPAPAPIRIRYGPAGLLGSAVAQAAAGEREARNSALDMQIISQMLDHSNRMKEMQFGSELEANKLQTAYALHRAQTQPQAPDTGGYYAGPLAGGGDPNTLLKNALLQNAEVSPEQAASLKTLVGEKNVTPDQLRSVLFEAKNKQKNTEADEKKARTAEAKQKYLKSLPPEVASQLSAYADDEAASLPQLRVAASELANRQKNTARVKLYEQVKGIDDQAHGLRDQMTKMSTAMKKEYQVDPEVASPASFNPQYENPSAYQGPIDEVVDAYNKLIPDAIGGTPTNLVKGADLSNDVTKNPKWAAYVTYQQMKQRLGDLIQQRTTLLNSDGSTSPGAKQLTPDKATEILGRAGGDKNLARSIAKNEGYVF